MTVAGVRSGDLESGAVGSTRGLVQRARSWPARALTIVCLLALLGAAARIGVHDPTSEPVSGDQASFVYQALSLRGGDLAYDATDQARWLELDWAEQPHGLFLQKRGDGWAFAKPVGYSVLLAPAMALFDARGIALVNAALLLAYAGCWYGLTRLRWDRVTALAVAAAATVASHAWLFGFPAHADLFVAVLVGVAALGAARVAWPRASPDGQQFSGDLPRQGVGRSPENHQSGPITSAGSSDHGGHAPFSGDQAGQDVSGPPENHESRPRAGAWSRLHRGHEQRIWLVLAAWAAALLVTEKLPALFALAPLLALAGVRSSWRARVAATAVGLVVLAVSVAPYLFYSDGASWSAYGGDRYYALNTTPWSGGTEADLTEWHTRDSLSPGFVFDQVTDPSEDLASATLTYAIGRHTGVLTFQPVAALLLASAAVAAAAGAWRRRSSSRTDRAGTEGTRPPQPASTSARKPQETASSSGTASSSWQPAATSAREPQEAAAGSGRGPVIAAGSAAGPEATAGAGWVGAAAALGLAGYVALYLVVFTDNYFGGGQSIGNRYFLQISPLVALVAASVPMSARVVRWCTAGAAAWALVFLHPLLRSPEEAYFHIERTSAAQRLLPFDGSQKHSWRFGCEPAECVPPPLEAFEG